MNPRPIDTRSRRAGPRTEESKKRTRFKTVSQPAAPIEDDLNYWLAARSVLTRRQLRKEFGRYKKRLKKQIAADMAALKALQKKRLAGETLVVASLPINSEVESGSDSPLRRDAA